MKRELLAKMKCNKITTLMPGNQKLVYMTAEKKQVGFAFAHLLRRAHAIPHDARPSPGSPGPLQRVSRTLQLHRLRIEDFYQRLICGYRSPLSFLAYLRF